MHSILAVKLAVVGLWWGIISPTALLAYYSGGGKDAARGNDCLVGYEFVDPDEVTNSGSKNQSVVCVDCDPSCDSDGVPTANGSCTMAAGVCINQGGVAGCTPPSALDEATAKGKVKGVKGSAGKIVIDTSQLLAGSACGAMVDVVMPLKSTKSGFKESKATLKLSASVMKDKAAGTPGRVDKDKLTYVCRPRPASEPCANATTTTLTSVSTTSTTIVCIETMGSLCDPGDGTIYDSATGLQWEKKTTAFGSGVNAADLHDVDNTYAWAGRCSVTTTKYCQPNAAAETLCKAQTPSASGSGCERCTAGEGTCNVDPISLGSVTTVWNWLAQVRAANYAGHADWRLPSEDGRNADPATDPRELEAILVSPPPSAGSPCIAPIFGPTATHFANGVYWSSSTQADLKTRAWGVDFTGCYPATSFKDVNYYVRAVRGGS